MNTREEQIELVKKLLKTGVSDDARMVLEKQFPEAVESEDERIRQAIVELLKLVKAQQIHTDYFDNYIKWDEMITYLEKQKSVAEEILAKAGIKPFKDGNQWSILVGDNIQEGICGFGDTIDEALYQFLVDVQEYQKEQKPAEWSEEDEKMLKRVLELYICYEADTRSKDTLSDIDIEVLNQCAEEKIWLKSRFKYLRPQPHWKPSEEQIEEFRKIIMPYERDRGGRIIYSLYDQLKAL